MPSLILHALQYWITPVVPAIATTRGYITTAWGSGFLLYIRSRKPQIAESLYFVKPNVNTI